MIESVISLLSPLFASAHVRWGIGGSVLLAHHGLVEHPNDVDLLFHPDDFAVAERILKKFGEQQPSQDKGVFLTRRFEEYTIGSVELDLIVDFKIQHTAGVFSFIFDETAVTEQVSFGGQRYPFMHLEDWYVFYLLMPGRESKVCLLEDYWQSHPFDAPERLQTALAASLPDSIRQRIEHTYRYAQ
ncbi:hypothetical protein [Exiguobacterium artemiae]|uniref:hypothetical protein n=1 Tax=Exiguobacterium artemiae TaxID=340145 RepID=UPI00047DA0FD|nr:hypothetical protein [Exiguobacterium sibiricum]